MLNNDKKIVAIYTRVSTLDQAREGHSLEEQEKKLRAKCLSQGYEIYKVYTDAGISGKFADNRPAYQQMMKDLKKGKFNLIVTLKMDRLSRSIIDFEEFLNEVKKHNCGVDLLYEQIDTTGATGMLFARILALFAQFEREMIQERTLLGIEGAVNKGHFCGKPPLGYRHKLGSNGEERLKGWEICEEEAKIVREIYDLCASGKTYFQIATILKKKYSQVISKYIIDKDTKEKIPIYRNWSDGSISKILNNKCYIGIYQHRKTAKDKEINEIVDKIPAIISKDLFYECQEAIQRNSRNYYRKKRYLFMQKIVCPKCGRILYCNGTKKPNNKKYLYYKCKECKTYIREELIEEKLLDELNNLLELSTILNSNNLIVDNKFAEDFNKCRIDHKIRFSIDKNIISSKFNRVFKDVNFNELWYMTSYETKCEFIQRYIDKIVIKKYEDKNNRIASVDLVELKIKPNRVSELLDYAPKGNVDKILGKEFDRISFTEMKYEKDALEYIELLKKKYKIGVAEKIDNVLLSTSLFKHIKINPVKAIEKEKDIYLFFLGPKEYKNGKAIL